MSLEDELVCCQGPNGSDASVLAIGKEATPLDAGGAQVLQGPAVDMHVEGPSQCHCDPPVTVAMPLPGAAAPSAHGVPGRWP